MDVTDSLPYCRLAFSAIYPLFVDRFGRSLRVCLLEFDMAAISDGVKCPVSLGGFEYK